MATSRCRLAGSCCVLEVHGSEAAPENGILGSSAARDMPSHQSLPSQSGFRPLAEAHKCHRQQHQSSLRSSSVLGKWAPALRLRSIVLQEASQHAGDTSRAGTQEPGNDRSAPGATRRDPYLMVDVTFLHLNSQMWNLLTGLPLGAAKCSRRHWHWRHFTNSPLA